MASTLEIFVAHLTINAQGLANSAVDRRLSYQEKPARRLALQGAIAAQGMMGMTDLQGLQDGSAVQRKILRDSSVRDAQPPPVRRSEGAESDLIIDSTGSVTADELPSESTSHIRAEGDTAEGDTGVVRALYVVLAAYVLVSLTIPFWVPLLQKLAGNCGVYWVFSILTYYAYLAWLIFAGLLLMLLWQYPVLGACWLGVLVMRAVQFSRLASRTPAGSTSNTSKANREATGSSAATELGRVLLVGNGPSLKGSNLGQEIDGFDTVVRFNSFVTRALEDHTGSKTTLWCHMMQWYHVATVEVANKTPWVPTCYAWNHVVLAPLFFVPFYLMPMLPRRTSFTWSFATYWRAHRFLGLRLHQVPTTGFVMLTRMLEQVETVHLVGFDGYASGGELHYYAEKRMQLQVNAAGALLHDWAKEQQGIRRLIEAGRVQMLPTAAALMS